MCGIVGFYSNNAFVSEEELKNMTSALGHRGPDAEGLYYKDTVGLGHKRLSIIDLSTDANQPMESHSMRYICVYNGEIYNYRNIAAELNMEFKTSCDTEVIVEAFAEWGGTFVNKLNGMFAIAIYDKQEQILYLFRDRMGVKPLFYFWDGENFAFSSEIKSLLQVAYIRQHRHIDNIAINEFLHLGFIPEPYTIYANIRKFPSGQTGIVSSNGFRTESYWNLENCVRHTVITDMAEAKEKIKETLSSSVAMRFVGDVPFGTFLSGGVDSSLVTAIAAHEYSKPIKTFSIGFHESKYDESSYARRVSKYLHTEHHEFFVTEREAVEIIADMLDFYDEPFADSSAIPTMMLSKLAKQEVSMVLCGDGGDELFHGYGAYIWARRLSSFSGKNLKHILHWLLSMSPSNRCKRASLLFGYKDKTTIKSHIFSQEQYLFTKEEVERFLNPAVLMNYNLEEDFSDFARKLTPAEMQAIFDLMYYLKDDLLVKVDRASMRYALESRIPLLDYRMVELALNIDPKLKISGNIQKYLLKEVLYDFIPQKYFDRPKWGFAVPLQKWLQTDLAFLINDFLNEHIIRDYNIVKFEEVRELITQFKSGRDYLYNRIWLLIVLHKFLVKDSAL